MNDQNRKELSQIISEIEGLLGRIESMKDDEQSKLDNMPENMRDGEKRIALVRNR